MKTTAVEQQPTTWIARVNLGRQMREAGEQMIADALRERRKSLDNDDLFFQECETAFGWARSTVYNHLKVENLQKDRDRSKERRSPDNLDKPEPKEEPQKVEPDQIEEPDDFMGLIPPAEKIASRPTMISRNHDLRKKLAAERKAAKVEPESATSVLRRARVDDLLANIAEELIVIEHVELDASQNDALLVIADRIDKVLRVSGERLWGDLTPCVGEAARRAALEVDSWVIETLPVEMRR
jgi:hypothetical protein